MLPSILRQLDERIVNDPNLDANVLARLTDTQRELGLTFGERVTCPFLRPHIVTRTQYDQVARAAQVIAAAVEKLVAHVLGDRELLEFLGLSNQETEMARFDPGYARLCVSSRLDAYLSDAGFQFLEYNAETPAGVADQMQLERLLFALTHVEELLKGWANWRPQPHRRLLAAMLEAYREWGGEEERPHIAIVDWKGVATESEFRVLQEYFSSEGYETTIADPHDLSYQDGYLRAGDFRIDIVYKRVVIHEFLERCNADHALARAYAEHRVCMMNSFRSKIAHKKAIFAVLSDPNYAHLFTPQEIEIFQQHIPWTRRVEKTTTTFEGVERDLLEIIRQERERFVLKPNDDYGGHGVFLGWESEPKAWDRALELARARAYVVQERAPMKKISMPTFGDQVRMEEMFVDFNPFLFHNEVEGALIRLSSSALLNVTAGGGQTALVVLEEM